jgi:uncharacterized protein involved in outer membrane biogenesis
MPSDDTSPTLRKPLNVWARRLLSTVVGLLVLWLVAWLGMPPLLKWQLQKQASERLGRVVTVERVDFRPWTLELTIEGLRLADAQGNGEQASVKRFYIDAELQSLLRLAPVVDAISVEQPRLKLRHLGEGRYDIDDVLARLPAPDEGPSDKPMRFALFNIAVTDGSFELVDDSVNHTHNLSALVLKVPFLSNLPSRRDVVTSPQLSFVLNGSAFQSQAATTPFADDQETQASLSIGQLDLSPYLSYWPALWPVRPESGVLQVDMKLAFEQRDEPRVALSGNLALSGFKLVQRDAGAGGASAPLLELDRLAVVLNRVEPLARRVDLGALTLKGPSLVVARGPAGQLNVVEMIGAWAKLRASSAPEPSSRGASEPEDGDWLVRLASLDLSDGMVSWRDAAVKPAVALDLKALHLGAKDLAWPMKTPLPFEASALLGTTTLLVQGSATTAAADVRLTLGDLPLNVAGPYLADLLAHSLTGRAAGEFALSWQAAEEGAPMALQVSAPRLTLNDLTLGAGKTPLLRLRGVQIEGVDVDVGGRSAVIGKLALNRPQLDIVRTKDGRWMYEGWIQPQKAVSGDPGPKKGEAAWKLLLTDMSVRGGVVGFNDSVPTVPVSLAFSGVDFQVHALRPLDVSQKDMPVSLSLRMGSGQSQRTDPGRLSAKGSLRLAASGGALRDAGLSLRVQVQAERLPVHALEPYFGDRLNLELLRADSSFKGKLDLAMPEEGPSVDLSGDFALEDFRANTLSPSEDLLAWKALNLQGVEFAMAPRKAVRLAVAETVLSDYFARVIVLPTGVINLQALVKNVDSAPAGSVPPSPPTAAPSGGPSLDPDIRFGPISLVNGKVFFSDRFIKPNYSANLSELTGGISAFSSAKPSGAVAPELADLSLKGRAEGTASLEIDGKLNPLVRPLALDIKGKVRDLELPPLSPYSVKYAGYGIERGKLSVDVAYRIEPNGQLSASNQIVLNQLSFGDRVAGSEAPNLPVKLAVALLADRSGVIDINLPVSGSINDPEFRLGPIIFRLIFNLIGKALTAPFSLLASALGGGGDELSQVDFQPGRARLSEEGRKRLDLVAKALTDRPALQLTVVGHSDLETERSAFQRARLEEHVLAEKRRGLVRQGAALTGTLVVTPEEYPELLKAVYKRADIPKPRNVVGFAKDLPVKEMEALLLASEPVGADAMRELAVARGVAVKDYLATRELPESRMFLGAPQLEKKGEKWRPQAELQLAPR